MSFDSDQNSREVKESDEVEESEPPLFRTVFSQLPLFEDLYMGMQAMNLDIIDDVLEQQETALLRKYIEIERTPVPETLFVSALSQLWVFGMYELLRTWRQRVEDVLQFVKAAQTISASKRNNFVLEKRRKVKHLARHALDSGWRYFSLALKSKKFRSQLENAYDRSELPSVALRHFAFPLPSMKYRRARARSQWPQATVALI